MKQKRKAATIEEKGVRLGRRILFPLYLDPPQKTALRQLSEQTRVPMAVFLREAVDDLLAKYARELKPRKEVKR